MFLFSVFHKPIGLTYVLYEVGSPLGLFFAYLSLSPLLDEFINTILKNIIAGQRPEGAPIEDYGMPSAHSEFAFFFATYFSLFLTLKVQMPRHLLWKPLLIVSTYCYAVLVAYSRLFLGYHSREQIIVGACLGVIIASLFYRFAHTRVTRSWFHRLEHSVVGKYLLLKDTFSIVPNVWLFEYDNYRQQQQRCAKLSNDKQR